MKCTGIISLPTPSPCQDKQRLWIQQQVTVTAPSPKHHNKVVTRAARWYHTSCHQGQKLQHLHHAEVIQSTKLSFTPKGIVFLKMPASAWPSSHEKYQARHIKTRPRGLLCIILVRLQTSCSPLSALTPALDSQPQISRGCQDFSLWILHDTTASSALSESRIRRPCSCRELRNNATTQYNTRGNPQTSHILLTLFFSQHSGLDSQNQGQLLVSQSVTASAKLHGRLHAESQCYAVRRRAKYLHSSGNAVFIALQAAMLTDTNTLQNLLKLKN